MKRLIASILKLFIGRTTGGMASMMDEMAKTLARRRAQVDKKEVSDSNDDKQ